MGSRSDHIYCKRYLRNRPPSLKLGHLDSPPASSWGSTSTRDFVIFPKMPPDKIVPIGPTSFSATVFCFATSVYLAARGVFRSL